MPEGQLQAAITQMRDAATAISTSAGRIDDSMKTVDAQVKALGPDQFMSDAAETFRLNYNTLTPKLIEAQKGLQTFMQKLRQSATEIENAGTSR